jgi:hypothetical protein
MSYLSQHPALGVLKTHSTVAEVLQIKEAIFHAALLAAVQDLHGRHPQLADGLSFAALEYIDAVHYVLSNPEQPDEKAVRYE